MPIRKQANNHFSAVDKQYIRSPRLRLGLAQKEIELHNRELKGNCFKITVAFPLERAILSGLLDKLSISRLGKSSVERVFSDDLKPDGREQSVKEQ